MKSGLIEDSLIVDEPEVSLHPAWVEVMAKLLHDISKKGVKVFIATHSDVFIEKMNWFLKHDEKFNLDVWKFERREDGNHARTLELEDREIPTVEYLDVYYNIVKGF
jgi:predicted ATPase